MTAAQPLTAATATTDEQWLTPTKAPYRNFSEQLHHADRA